MVQKVFFYILFLTFFNVVFFQQERFFKEEIHSLLELVIENCIDNPIEMKDSSVMSGPFEESEVIKEYLVDVAEIFQLVKYHFDTIKRDKLHPHYYTCFLKTFSPPPEQDLFI